MNKGCANALIAFFFLATVGLYSMVFESSEKPLGVIITAIGFFGALISLIIMLMRSLKQKNFFFSTNEEPSEE